MAITIDTLDRLKSQLLTSGLQDKNQPLFQIINLLIDAVRQGFGQVNTQVFTPSSGGVPGGIANQTFITYGPDSASLPNSAQLLAGAGIQFNKDGNKLTISTALPLIMGEKIGEEAEGVGSGIENAVGGFNTLFTTGSVIFAGLTGQFAQDNTNFFWDDTNNRLRVPTLVGGTGVDDDLILQSTTGVGTTNSRVFVKVGNNGAITAVEIQPDTLGNFGRMGIGTSGVLPVDAPLTIFGTGPTRGYLILAQAANNAPSAYIQLKSASIDTNAHVGFSFYQTVNVAEWAMHLAGNDQDSIKFSSYPGGVQNDRLYMTFNRGNIIIDSARNEPTNGTKTLIIGDGTAPSVMAANTSGLYGDDVGGTVNLFCINEADEVTQLSGNMLIPAARTFGWSGRAKYASPADSIITLLNAAENNFDRLQFGGTTSSFPALKRNSAVLETRLADDSAYAQHKALEYMMDRVNFLMRNASAWNNGAAAAVGTLNNAPAAGDPTKWIPVDDNGTTRYIPAW